MSKNACIKGKNGAHVLTDKWEKLILKTITEKEGNDYVSGL
ncbi:hypothetical protein CBFG_02656 [Clostridiales bacterium 1_7_47FAA]|nr:hypothetical protein CBFG_02656 [Clostridiales bacterium 1_7_47FAA]